MDAFSKLGLRNVSGCVGSLISVALVLCGANGRAEGITGFGGADQALPGLVGSFSAADLEQLEHSTAAQATAARLAALGTAIPETNGVRARFAAADLSSPKAETEVFQHSGSLMPLLVARPDTATSVAAQPAVKLRPGLVQPVGVPVSSLRPLTPAERAAR